MEKRTLLAIVLSVVIIAGYGFYSYITTQEQLQLQAKASPAASTKPSPSVSPSANSANTANTATTPAPTATMSDKPGTLADPNLPADAIVPVGTIAANTEPVIFDNGTLRVTFNPNGAGISSLKLVGKKDNKTFEYQDGEDPVEMIMPGENSGLQMRFGSKDSPLISVPFERVASSDKNIIEFRRTFCINGSPSKTFQLSKKYTFYPTEFLFKLEVAFVNSNNESIPLNQNGAAYSLYFGPQVGPISSRIVENQDPRRFIYLLGGKDKKIEAANKNAEISIKDPVSWITADGKYFTFVVIPGASKYLITLQNKEYDRLNKTVEKQQPGIQFNLAREPISSSQAVDTYLIYAGPKVDGILQRYNKDSDNKAGQNNLKLNEVLDSGNPIGWLEEILKWIMGLFYKLIPNWGIAIILLTILVKVLLYPLSKKGMVGMARMQALNPKMTEIRAKYKDNPQKMNAEIGELYKKEKINPLGGCLPMLLQLPFFFAMYNLFYNHFDLRGALFIPGWIPDLSVPDSILHFSFVLPLFGTHVTGLHLLPFLYLASQFLTTKLTQNTSGSMSNAQANFMMYGLPAVFFFILYEGPSGLFVYWIFQNILSIFQQQYINKHLENMKLRQKPENPRTAAAATKKRNTK